MTGLIDIGLLPDGGAQQPLDQIPSLREDRLVYRTRQSVSGVVVFSGVPIIIGQAVTMGTNGYYDGYIIPAIATSLLLSNVVGFAAKDLVSSEEVPFSNQFVTVIQSLTVGEVYYLSDVTPGAITSIMPSTSGNYIVQVGTAFTTHQLLISIGQPILIP